MLVAMHALFVVLLALGALRSAQTIAHPAPVVIGCLALLCWYIAGVRFASATLPVLGRWWLAILVTGWTALAFASVQLSWVAFALFFLVLHVLPRLPGLLVVAAITAVVVAMQLASGDGPAAARIIGPCIGAAVAVGVAWIYSQLRTESENRRIALQNLAIAQEELVASQDDLVVAQRRAGVLEERSRLAREIHDTLAQGFSSILLLSRAGMAGEPDPDRLRGILRQIETTAGTGLQDARTVVHALRPVELSEASLPDALGRLLDRHAEQTGQRVSLDITGMPRALPPAIEVAILRVAQGAIGNVRQHANADTCDVHLTYDADNFVVRVHDDGVGFAVPAAQVVAGGDSRGGFGLRAMRERVREAGGSLVVTSAVDAGTDVVVRIPVAADASAVARATEAPAAAYQASAKDEGAQ